MQLAAAKGHSQRMMTMELKEHSAAKPAKPLPEANGDEHASLAKGLCPVRMRETVGWVRELLGANGILLDQQIGRFVADAEAPYSYEGTREMNSLIAGKAITGFSAFLLRD
jgi:alkylation response protein AidB-like acyl-CoA dehydrogenase